MRAPHDPFAYEGLPADPDAAWAKARAEFGEADRSQWVIEKETLDAGRTLSREAIQRTVAHIGLFISVRLNDIWNETGKPPQRLAINVHVPGPEETEDDLLRARSRLQGALADVDLRLAAYRAGR